MDSAGFAKRGSAVEERITRTNCDQPQKSNTLSYSLYSWWMCSELLLPTRTVTMTIFGSLINEDHWDNSSIIPKEQS